MTDGPRDLPRVEVRSTSPGRFRLVVDGTDISSGVTAVQIEQAAGQLPVVSAVSIVGEFLAEFPEANVVIQEVVAAGGPAGSRVQAWLAGVDRQKFAALVDASLDFSEHTAITCLRVLEQIAGE